MMSKQTLDRKKESPPIPKDQLDKLISTSHSRGRKWPKFRECGWIVKTFFPTRRAQAVIIIFLAAIPQIFLCYLLSSAGQQMKDHF
jgi:hypothetical protein